ncbi:hypothetical protein Bca101_056074 [Brassica carinata]
MSSLLESTSSIGSVKNLYELDLTNCSSLVEIPASILNATNLKKLTLSGCSSLVDLPSSIDILLGLNILNLTVCSSLKNLPSSFGNVKSFTKSVRSRSILVDPLAPIRNASSLKTLDFSGCSSLKTLDLSGCSGLKTLPSIGNIKNLHELIPSSCSNLLELPACIGNATSLKTLDLSGCLSLKTLDHCGCSSLKTLDLCGCLSLKTYDLCGFSSLKTLDHCGCSSLKTLDLCGCSSLKTLPSSIRNIKNLPELILSSRSNLVELPASIGNATSLKTLDLCECSSLKSLPSIGDSTSLIMLNVAGCSGLVELLSFIEHCSRYPGFILKGWSKLEALPTRLIFRSLCALDLPKKDITQKRGDNTKDYESDNNEPAYARSCASSVDDAILNDDREQCWSEQTFRDLLKSKTNNITSHFTEE